MNKYIAEFIGTFFLVLTVAAPSSPARRCDRPLAIAPRSWSMVFATGHISGGTSQPGVTLAVFLRGKCPARDVIPYWIAQVAAGVVAAFVAIFLCGKSGTPMEITNVPAAFVAEFVFHFRACLVVLKRRHGQRHGEQLLLRAGHRHDRDGRRVRRRRHLRWRFTGVAVGLA